MGPRSRCSPGRAAEAPLSRAGPLLQRAIRGAAHPAIIQLRWPVDLGAILTAMVTPFDADGRVDEEAAVASMHHLVDHGSDGLVIVRHHRRGRRR